MDTHSRALDDLPRRLEELTGVLTSYVERDEVSGFVAQIDRGGECVYDVAVGWRDREQQLPMQRDTIFRIMSMTKPIIAVATLQLVERGAIKLHEPIDHWLPELAQRMVLRDPHAALTDVYPSPRPITLHDILTFQLGIGWGNTTLRPYLWRLIPDPYADLIGAPDAEQLGPDAWLARLGEYPLAYPPGAYWLYHVAAEVLGVLIARVSGMSLPDYLQEQVFEPLGMVDTGYAVPATKQQRLAVLYGPTEDGHLRILDSVQESRWNTAPLFPSGGGGLVSAVGDCQRFARMLLGNGQLDGVRLLSSQMVTAMTTDYLTPEQHTQPFFAANDYWTYHGFGYGIAVQVREDVGGPRVGSFYWPGAFGTTWIADPTEDLVATLLIQLVAPNPFVTPIGTDFITQLYQALGNETTQ